MLLTVQFAVRNKRTSHSNPANVSTQHDGSFQDSSVPYRRQVGEVVDIGGNTG